MLKLVAAGVAILTLLGNVQAADHENGVYSCAYEGAGAKVRRTDGGEVVLGAGFSSGRAWSS